jgi:hypothetical protein
VGAPGKLGNTGAAYVFNRVGSIWSQQSKLSATDAATNDYLGRSVCINVDRVALGADDDLSSTGAVYIFNNGGSGWAQQSKLTASDTAAGSGFGNSVAISADTMVVGAHWKNSGTGAAYIYNDSFTPPPTTTTTPPTTTTAPPTTTTTPPTTTTAPIVGTLPSGQGSIGSTSATLYGNIVSMGSAVSVIGSFEYGTTASYGNSISYPSPMYGPGSFGVAITGLTPGTTYHYRANLDGGGSGVAYGADVTFTTLSLTPATISTTTTTTLPLTTVTSAPGTTTIPPPAPTRPVTTTATATKTASTATTTLSASTTIATPAVSEDQIPLYAWLPLVVAGIIIVSVGLSIVVRRRG